MNMDDSQSPNLPPPPSPPGLNNCCADPGGCQLCCVTFMLPCYTFGTVVKQLPGYENSDYACPVGTGIYGLLWYFPTFLSCCGAASTGASSTLSLLAGLCAGYVNEQALRVGIHKERAKPDPVGCIPRWVCKGIFCSPCALCQASNYLTELDKYKTDHKLKLVGSKMTFVAPRAKMMSL